MRWARHLAPMHTHPPLASYPPACSPQLLDPQLQAHLESIDALSYFFCFRWLLVLFKREFRWECSGVRVGCGVGIWWASHREEHRCMRHMFTVS